MYARFAALAGVLVLSAAPPVAKRVDRREVRHGATVIDNYYWLREKSNPEVIRYLEAENAYTESLTKDVQGFSQALYKEMLGRIKQTDLSVPERQGEYLYYSRTEEGKQYPIRCRRKGSMEAPEQVLLDLNELAVGHKFMGLGAFATSDDAALLAYTVDNTGFRQYTLHVKDLTTGKTLPDTAARVTSLDWAADNRTLFFATEDPVTKRSDRMFRLKLGGTASEIYNEADELYRIHLERTRDRKFLFLNITSTDTTEVRAEAKKKETSRREDRPDYTNRADSFKMLTLGEYSGCSWTADYTAPTGDKWAEYFVRIKTRKRCNADIEYGQRSSSLCYLVNIAREVGHVGEVLKWNPGKEHFTNCDAGNALLSRARRKGYELPA